MDTTLMQLFAAGAQHTVSAMLEAGRATAIEIQERLIGRFPFLTERDSPAIFQLIRNVRTAMSAAGNIARRQTSLPSTYGINSAIPDNYQYTVIAYLPDPNDENKPVSIP